MAVHTPLWQAMVHLSMQCFTVAPSSRPAPALNPIDVYNVARIYCPSIRDDRAFSQHDAEEFYGWLVSRLGDEWLACQQLSGVVAGTGVGAEEWSEMGSKKRTVKVFFCFSSCHVPHCSCRIPNSLGT